MMVSWYWVVIAFYAGAIGGIVLISICRASSEPDADIIRRESCCDASQNASGR